MSWQERAACAQLDARTTDDLFFSHHNSRDHATAREFCGHCPVQLQCRTYADQAETQPYPEGHVAYGVWGGESAHQRDQRRRGIRGAA